MLQVPPGMQGTGETSVQIPGPFFKWATLIVELQVI